MQESQSSAAELLSSTQEALGSVPELWKQGVGNDR